MIRRVSVFPRGRPHPTRLRLSAPRPACNRFAPSRKESRDESVLAGGLDGERRQRERDRQRDVITLRARARGALIGRMRAIYEHDRFNEAAGLRVSGTLLELNRQAEPDRSFWRPRVRNRRGAARRLVFLWRRRLVRSRRLG